MSDATPGVLLAAVCAASGAFGLSGWVAGRDARYERVGGWLGLLCFLLAALIWVARWSVAGHMPLFGTYESGLSLALAVLAATLLTRRRPAAALLRSAARSRRHCCFTARATTRSPSR